MASRNRRFCPRRPAGSNPQRSAKQPSNLLKTNRLPVSVRRESPCESRIVRVKSPWFRIPPEWRFRTELRSARRLPEPELAAQTTGQKQLASSCEGSFAASTRVFRYETGWSSKKPFESQAERSALGTDGTNGQGKSRRSARPPSRVRLKHHRGFRSGPRT
jgi:hypothetical protein